MKVSLASEAEQELVEGAQFYVREANEELGQAFISESGFLYYVAYVDRGHARRIISLRRANRREVKHYVETCQAD